MIKSLISTLFFVIIHPFILKADANNFYESQQTQSLSDFFNHQNQRLSSSITQFSLIDEIQTRMFFNCIEMLQLPKSTIPVGGNLLASDSFETVYTEQIEKFVDQKAQKIDGVTANTLILINLYAQYKKDDGNLSNPHKLSFFTTFDVFFKSKNLLEYTNFLAILNQWEYYSDFNLTIIHQRSRIQALCGLTAAQESSDIQHLEIEQKAGKDNVHFYTPKAGGAPQLYVAHTSNYTSYHLGPVSNKEFKKISIYNVEKNKWTNLPISEFLTLPFSESFHKIHHLYHQLLQSPYYQNPYLMLFDDQKQVHQLVSLLRLKPYHTQKSIVFYKNTFKEICIFKPLHVNRGIQNITLNQTKITSWVRRVLTRLK